MVLAVCVLYFFVGKLGLLLAFVNASTTAVWPPAGVALAALLLLGYRVWPAILIGAFFVNFTTNGTALTSVSIAVGNTLEALIGAWLLQRFARGERAFERPKDIVLFGLLTLLVSTPVSAIIGVTTLMLGGLARWSDYGSIWLTWWLGDATGVIVFAPLIILWSARPAIRWKKRQWGELGLVFCLLLALGIGIFGGFSHYPLEFLCLPLLIWIAFRFTQRETALGVFLLSMVALWGTLRGFGPFAVSSPNISLLLLQVFIGVLSITKLMLAAAMMERQRTEQELHRAQALLEQKELDTVKSEFVTLASHQLRTPLSGMRWSLELLQQRAMGPLTEKQKKLVQNLLSAMTLMADTIGTMLLFAQLEARKIVPQYSAIDLCAALEAARINHVQACALKNIDCRVACAGPMTIQGDARLLGQLFSILLDNAISYTPHGGTITLRGGGVRSDTHASITVTDTGIGIPAKDSARVFTKFYRADNARKIRASGTGLGLYLASKITALLDGTIDVGPAEGGGTMFTIRLPMHPYHA